MEEDECTQMLNHLQQYVVHLEKLIKQLKDPKKQNRELQLHKLEGLHSMITDRRKKLKLDTLKKCEDVILKILQKVNPNIMKQLKTFPEAPSNNLMRYSCKDPPNEKELVPHFDTQNKQLEAARARLLEISTPASPSPPKEILSLSPHSPIVIPTEKIKQQTVVFRRNSLIEYDYKTEKPDIYSKAAKTLISIPNKAPVFDRLGTRVEVDMSKPPLSDEDLKSLVAPERDDFNADDLSIDQLVDLRHVLTKKLHSPQTNIKYDVNDLRTKLKNREKKLNLIQANKGGEELKAGTKPRSPRVEVIIKDPDSVFGNLLSSIDDQILGDKKKEKKDGVVKEDKVKNTEKDKKEQSREKKVKHIKDDKRLEKSDNKDEKKKEHRDSKKGSKSIKKGEPTKDDKGENKDKDDKGEHKNDKNKDRKKEHRSRSHSKSNDSDKSKHRNKESSKVDEETIFKVDGTRPPENQTFKRLADKYNPRPRKNSVEEIPKSVTDETRVIFDKSIAALDGIIFNKSQNLKPSDPRRESFNFQPPSDPNSGFIPPQLQKLHPGVLSNSIPTVVNYHSKYQQHNISNHPNSNHGGLPIMNNFIIQNSNTINNHQINNHQINNHPINNHPINNHQINNHQINNHQINNQQINNHPINNQQMGFPNTSSKAFHPYDPIDSNNTYEYDLSKMQPADFYSPNYAPTAQSLPSPPNYANRPPHPSVRDPRLQQRADPRKANEEQRFDRHREDPRLARVNRDPRRRDSVDKPKFSHNKYDSLYSNIDRNKPKETFVSPLDMLYTSAEPLSQKVGKGYGFQSFRIPKKKMEKKKLRNVKESRHETWENIKNEDQLDQLNDAKDEKPEIDFTKDIVTEQIKVPEEKKAKIKEDDDISLSSTIDEKSLFTNIITKVIQSSDQTKLINAILSTFEDTVNDKQKKSIKKLRRIIETDSEDEQIETSEKVEKEVKIKKEDEEKAATKVADDKVSEQTQESEEDETVDDNQDLNETNEEEEEESKIKKTKTRRSRKRSNRANNLKRKRALQQKKEKLALNENSSTGVRKRSKCKTELDKLHEDIKEMFIRDGVLTASGKRVCRILKKDEEDEPEERETELKDAIVSESQLLDSPKRHARDSNPKVVLEKTDLSKHFNLYADSDSESETITTRSSSRSKEQSLSPEKLTLKRNVKKPNYNEEVENESSFQNEETPAEDTSSTSLLNTSLTKKVNKRKRRNNNWASGVIPKKVAKKKAGSNSATPTPLDDDQTSIVSEIEEEEASTPNSEMEYCEPDKDYYVQPNVKADCKLCHFKGRMIIQHYKNVHPRHEILISRLSPQIAEEAINESFEKGLDDFEMPVINSEPKHKRNRYTYQCRFCQVFFKNETTDLFFDHLTSHTGEYRFGCSFCPFKTANNKSLRSHIHSSHYSRIDQAGPINPLYPAQTDYYMIFAYICADCNFVQLNKDAMERHVNMCHSSGAKKIIKINLSMIATKDKEVEEESAKQSTSDDLEEEIASEEKKESIEKEDETVVEDVIQAKEVTLEDEGFAKKSFMDVSLGDDEENDSTVFNAKDYLLEATKLDDQKHRKMAEITKTILPKKRFELNLLDKIKSRLENRACETPPDVQPQLEETVREVVKNIPNAIASTSTADILKVETIQETHFIEPKKTYSESLEKPFCTKNSKPISHLITRLQGKLNDSLQPPPLTPLEELDFEDMELKPEELIARVGPLMVGMKKDNLLYVCNMKSCMYSSRDHVEFKLHCKTLHRNKFWDGFCDTCKSNVGVSDTMGAYTHLVEVHSCANDKASSVEQKVKTKPYLRMRKLSGDILSEKIDEEVESFVSPAIVPPVVEHVIPPILHDNDGITEEAHSFPFQISNVTSLADEEENTIETVSEPPPLQLTNVSNILLNSTFVPTAACPGLSTNVGPTIMFPLQLQTSNRGTVEIMVSPISTFCNSPSTSANKSPSLVQLEPKLATTTPKGTKKIILKDTCMQTEEAMKPRKSESAKKTMLSMQSIAHLYKCPDFHCDYSTNIKIQFEAHLAMHTQYKPDMLIACLYCNYKTTYGTIGIHYDIRHSRSLYCCAYCFYRAYNQSYVEVHQELTHPKQNKKVYSVPQTQDALKSVANIPVVPKKDVVMPYKCGQLGCERKFVLATDFEEHLRSAHKGVPLLCFHCENSPKTILAAIIHAQTHLLFYYHCAYCLFGADRKDIVYKHLSNTHFALPPQVIYRKFVPSPEASSSKDLNYCDDKIYDHLFVDTKEDFNNLSYCAKIMVNEPPKKQVSLIKQFSGGKLLNASEKVTLYRAPVAKIKEIHTISKTEIVISDDEDESLSPNKASVFNSSAPQIILNKTNPIGNFKSNSSLADGVVLNFIDMSKDNEVENIPALRQTDPLKINHEPSSKTIGAPNFVDSSMVDASTEIENSKDLTTKSTTNLTGIDLFRCDVCNAGFLTSQTFKSHIMRCVTVTNLEILKPFKCIHCVKAFKSATGLIDHISIHGIARYVCILCDFKHQHKHMLKNHMKIRHKVNSILFYLQDASNTNPDQQICFVKPKSVKQRNSDEDSISSSNSFADTSLKTSYGSDEISQLPLNPIFPINVKCSECTFESKVRGNLLRHLLSHLNNVPVPSSEPVNPVPCLEKNEKMFDKMTNLAHSSFSEGRMSSNKKVPKEKSGLSKEEEIALPMFVPASQRYVCGASNCQYLNQEESILKQHVTAFHSYESLYKCSHCQESLSTEKGVINADYIIKHLKLHDLNLYKCHYCKFLSHLRNKVERHVIEKHPNDKPLVVVVREMEQEPGEPQNEELKEAKPWRCSMCKFRSTTKSECVSHAFNRHEVQTQYKCALCMFGSDNKSCFMDHFEDKHAGQEVHVIDAYYEVDGPSTSVKSSHETSPFDTTPLWQRNKNSFKHIRGIPIEESNKSPKKSPMKATINLVNAIEAVANGSAPLRNPGKKPKTLKEKKMELNANLMEEAAESSNKVAKNEKPRRFPKIKVNNVVDVNVISDSTSLDMLVDDLGEVRDNDFDVIVDDADREQDNVEISYTLQDFEKMDIIKLRDVDFRNSIGRFGKPHNNQYVCPICNAFTTNKANEFSFHLYKELEYARYVCTICKLRGQSFNSLKRHAVKKHINSPESILQLSPDPEIEAWVSIVLLIQRRLIFENCENSTQTSSSELKSDQNVLHVNKCKYCIYTTKNFSDMRKHERRHCAEKPYQCCFCSYMGVKESEIQQHSALAHPNEVQIPINLLRSQNEEVQATTSKKRKYVKINEIDEETKPSLDKPNEDSLSFDDVEEESDNQIYFVCNYCPKRCDSELEVRTHWHFTHEAKQPIFKFKKVKSDSIVKRGTLFYKCYYCDFISQVETMKKHIKREHAGSKFVVFRYKCGHENCSFYLKNLDAVKTHCKLQHGSTSSLYENIRKPVVNQNCKCAYCKSVFTTRDELVRHHDNFHSHLEGKFPPEISTPTNEKSEDDEKRYKCPQCLQVYERYSSIRDHVRLHAKPFICGYCTVRFSYPSAAKTHHSREHPSLEFKCESHSEGQKMYEKLRASVLVLSEDGTYVNARFTKSWKGTKIDDAPEMETEPVFDTSMSSESFSFETPAKRFKQTARKSTTQIAKRVKVSEDGEEGFSYYGCKPDADDISNVRTHIPFMDSTILVNISQIPFLNLFPTLKVVDIMKYPLQP